MATVNRPFRLPRFKSWSWHVRKENGRIISAAELRDHSLRCRIQFRLHALTHRYRNYEITSPAGDRMIMMVSYSPRVWPWSRNWTVWLRPAPDALWEKHDPAGFAERMKDLIAGYGAGE